MIKLNLPPYPARVTEDQGKAKILDVLRRRYVALTPEEWVRQHFVHYLIEYKHYPAALLANEVRLTIGGKSVYIYGNFYSLFTNIIKINFT